MTDSELIKIFDIFKEQNPGLSGENILKLWVSQMNNNGTHQLKNKFEDIIDFAKRINTNKEYVRMLLLFSQIATFSPVMKSEEKSRFVCDDLESLLVNYMKEFRRDADI